MTNDEETNYIHGLLDLMKDRPNGFFVADEGMPKLGFGQGDYSALMRRLEEEKLATPNYATNMVITAQGLQIAREPGGYKAYLKKQQQSQFSKSIQEALGAYGSIISGVAGVVGVLIAGASLIDSHQTASELDGLRTQVKEQTKNQSATEARLAALEKQSQELVLAYQKSATTPSTTTTKAKATPTPAPTPSK
jgi:hypothetical protein